MFQIWTVCHGLVTPNPVKTSGPNRIQNDWQIWCRCNKHWKAIESYDEFEYDDNTDGSEDFSEVISGPGSDTEISNVEYNFSNGSVQKSDKIVDEKFGVNGLRTRQEVNYRESNLFIDESSDESEDTSDEEL